MMKNDRRPVDRVGLMTARWQKNRCSFRPTDDRRHSLLLTFFGFLLMILPLKSVKLFTKYQVNIVSQISRPPHIT